MIPMSHGERSGELCPSLHLPWQREAVGRRASALLHPACQNISVLPASTQKLANVRFLPQRTNGSSTVRCFSTLEEK